MQTLIEALAQAKQEGYQEDFNLWFSKKNFSDEKVDHFSEHYHLDKVFRVDEMTDPADQSVVYAISSNDGATKGVLVNSYGIYSDSNVNKVMEHLDSQMKDRLDGIPGKAQPDRWVL